MGRQGKAYSIALPITNNPRSGRGDRSWCNGDVVAALLACDWWRAKYISYVQNASDCLAPLRYARVLQISPACCVTSVVKAGTSTSDY